MKGQGLHKILKLPELGCNDRTAHHEHDVDNTPEVMPLETYLFIDLDGGVESHITRAIRLSHEDPMKFSLSIHSLASSTFRRTWK